MVKTLKKEQQLKGKISNSQDCFNGVNGHISREEKEKYKPYVREYIDAKKITVNARGLTNCPSPEHHNNGDRNPSARVYPDHLWCYKEQRKYDIYAIARKLNGGDFKVALADVINTLGEIK